MAGATSERPLVYQASVRDFEIPHLAETKVSDILAEVEYRKGDVRRSVHLVNQRCIHESAKTCFKTAL